MKTILINKILSKQFIINLILFFIVFLFSIQTNPSLIPKTSPDSSGYVSVSKDFTNYISNIRPFFFPLIIRVSYFISNDSWQIVFSLFQLTLHSMMVVLLFRSFKLYNLSSSSSFLCSILIGFNPSLLYYSTYVLADFILAILTTLSWFFLLRLNFQKDSYFKYAILSSVFSGLCIVTKPIALLMIVPIIFAVFFLNNCSKKVLKISILMILLNFSFHFSWIQFKNSFVLNSEYEQSSILWGGLNMTAIRGGLIKYGEGTKLYSVIEEEGMLEKAKNMKIKMSYTMDTESDYIDIYKALSKYTGMEKVKLMNDEEFAMKVIKKAPIPLFYYAISNWHSFFTKRSFNPSFPKMPKFLKKLYDYVFAILYRPLLLLLLMVSFFQMFLNKNFRLMIISLSIILYSSLIISILTPHGGEFPRYRIWIEYIMWFCALIPVGLLMDKIVFMYNKNHLKLLISSWK
ncbi:MAG: hypothetical protein ACJZ10_02680 [Candidatus Neomarinimicrobiota bacterium]